MSGIYIPNMEMPKACFWKESKDGCTHTCFLAGTCQASSYTLGKYGVKPDSCPLVEVPTHGRLIDVDKLLEEHPRISPKLPSEIFYNNSDIFNMLDDAPTVIEASTESTEERE